MSDMSPEEIELAIGAHGLEKAPWYSAPLVRRILAELQRQIDSRPDEYVGDTLLNVVAPSMVESWLAAVEPKLGMAATDAIRTYGRDEHGLVWPGSRSRLAPEIEAADPDAAATLRRRSPPGTIFLVVTYGEPGAHRSVMAPLPYHHFPQQQGARHA
jgi:hypothetical protein